VIPNWLKELVGVAPKPLSKAAYKLARALMRDDGWELVGWTTGRAVLKNSKHALFVEVVDGQGVLVDGENVFFEPHEQRVLLEHTARLRRRLADAAVERVWRGANAKQGRILDMLDALPVD
jgi:hypothetical protein